MEIQSQEEARPPSRRDRFTVGRDAEGHWIVCDSECLIGGLFVNKEAALHFAIHESERTADSVCCAADNEILRLGNIF